MTGVLISRNPATGDAVWQGDIADAATVAGALTRARVAQPGWADLALDARIAIVRAFAARVTAARDEFAAMIARETGKPLWEAAQEVGSVIGKIDISIAAQAERAGERSQAMPFGRAVLRHRPHGVFAVLGPYNFPAHLPNGHIVPALLAGDAVVFKPSEETPGTGAMMARFWQDAGLPDGVLNIVQGGRETGVALAGGAIDGLLFTGSAQTGMYLRRLFAERPEVILALELGGNNPLIAWDGDPAAMASIIAQSAFISAGQRCSCARRLIVPDGARGQAIIDALLAFMDRICIGAWDERPEPAIGPLVSMAAADRARAAAAELAELGARVLKPLATPVGRGNAFVTPALFDATGISVPDEEIFAPLLQIVRVADFDAAIAAANATRFGLAAGLLTQDRRLWHVYARRARAGVLNWNRPTTGATGSMPFGGIGASGNLRPSAYYAADYCAYPVASFEAEGVSAQSQDWPGLVS
ncbi:MAG: succinylglutamate-semialdehyde dehydrogenase [Blastomonas sp. CACIA14H2]|uniref:succinylglutamate-semialdehyde dehydrogenase n=1 Tax=Blastomonas sp. CACIA14H2 TaxID=1419876 RepID=UPI0003D025D5|nr:MAG: succinylglutamate-semialdehyde dehydrogenase [Blastomonas sp. CACIA14H2]